MLSTQLIAPNYSQRRSDIVINTTTTDLVILCVKQHKLLSSSEINNYLKVMASNSGLRDHSE